MDPEGQKQMELTDPDPDPQHCLVPTTPWPQYLSNAWLLVRKSADRRVPFGAQKTLAALFLVSRPLYPVYQLSQCPLFVALFHWSCPLLLCFPSSVPLSLFFCTLSFIFVRMRVFFKYTCIHLMPSYEPVLYFSPLSRLCTLSPILCPLSQSTFSLYIHICLQRKKSHRNHDGRIRIRI